LAVRQLLVNDRFRREASAVRRSFEEAGGMARAADAVFAFTKPARARPSHV
jgi:UDP:flavonoid glycosyltransferase YjiC (YdhE family)